MIALLLILWAAGTYLNAGFIYAYDCGKWPDLRGPEEDRGNLAFCLVYSALVITWILTPFTTSFYYYGWKRPGSR